MILHGILFLVLVGISWVVSGIVVGRAPKDGVDVGILVFLESLTAFVVSLSIGLAGGMPQAGGRAVVWTLSILFIGGIVNNRQLVDMGRAMQEGPNGIIWSIIQCGFVIPAVVGVTFLGDLLNAWKLLGFIALLIALAIMGLAGDNSQGKDGNHWKWLAFRAFLWTGVSQLLANIPSYLDSADKISGVWRTMASTGGMAFATPFFALFDAKGGGFVRNLAGHVARRRVWMYVILNQSVGILASIFFEFRGMDIMAKAGMGAVSFPLMVGSCIIAFDLYSMAVLKEKRSPVQLLALLMCLAGAVAICL